jgi:hypothetical protein
MACTRAECLSSSAGYLEGIELVADPATSFVVLMKDGKIFKNTVR